MGDNTIDNAIKSCEERINSHLRATKRFMLYILISLLFFGTLQALNFYLDASNKNRLSGFIDEMTATSDILRGNIVESNTIIQRLEAADNMLNRQLLPPSGSVNMARHRDSIYKLIELSEEEITRKKALLDSAVKDVRSMPTKFQGSLYKIDNTAIYIFYGIFILVFGVLTSFYRFHLKEVSKYEQFSFGLQRIRIAGNNSKTGYEDDVKASLAHDAFSLEARAGSSKSGRVESPIPGHPSSDAFSFLMNKILNSVEITAKPKGSS